MENKYYDEALEFVIKEFEEDSGISYLGDYEGYEVYRIKDSDKNNFLVDEYILANEDGLAKSYYHESVAISRKFGL
ncbi:MULTISPECIES: hypothetical protein [Anaerococcus]|jgi:hypothetical protein|uniref:Uncharacterized protein n=1 Tax=Anaerococcus octavius TaxID=54007 RepID=A0A2I1M8K1_9FIRM|nr:MULTISPECIES: hypothetical protein [Anaerococcus]MDU2598797.1 hypothetical protein [Anaerococcus sp.]MDU3177583.1 hypothetical protein [Anaerococcus sp.]MDU4025925.1 hypothetical protein [Anaerococcus sp.]PKZ16450.1 hypothetical protein CYJ34_06440 [Anaerococcus octavius]